MSLYCCAANQLPLSPNSEVTFHLLLIWFLLLATCLSQWANEMAASLGRARLPSMDKQLQPHTVQMPCLTVPAIPAERNSGNSDKSVCGLCKIVHVLIHCRNHPILLHYAKASHKLTPK